MTQPLLAVARVVFDQRVGLDHATDHLEKADTAREWIAHRLENKHRRWLFVRDGTQNDPCIHIDSVDGPVLAADSMRPMCPPIAHDPAPVPDVASELGDSFCRRPTACSCPSPSSRIAG